MSRCRSCQAPIIWGETAAGRRIPLDAEPAPGGNVRLVPAPGGRQLAEVVTQPDGQEPLRLPHHASCPDGDSWRRRRRAGGR